MKINPQNVILITYKNKILLSTSDIPLQKSEWDFVKKRAIRAGLSFTDNSSLESAPEQAFTYIKLSDENVNSIARKNGQRLEFYSISEIEKLPLSAQASELFSKYKTDMVKLSLE